MKKIYFTYFKRLLRRFLLAGIICCCVGCGSAEKPPAGEAANTENLIEKAEQETAVTMDGSIEQARELEEGDITVPHYMHGEGEEDFSIVSKDDSSVTYHLDGTERTKAANQMADQIQSSVDQVLADKEHYPHLVSISVNGDCSEFNAAFSTDSINIYETTLQMSLFIVGNKYQLYQGKDENEILTVVNYIDKNSGAVFSSNSSSEIQ